MTHIIKYDPMRVLSDINQLFEQTFHPLSHRSDSSNIEMSEWMPAVDLKEEEGQFKLLIDLPGMGANDVQISMENNALTIQGERSAESKEERENYYRVERTSGKFYRRFSLPETADEGGINAQMKKGVLTITIAKKAAAKPKAITIEAHD